MKKPTILSVKLASLAVAAAGSLFCAGSSFGQQQVQGPVNQSVNYGPTDARLVPLIGQELYGNNSGLSNGRYVYGPQTSYLPSENRFATERTGALPSELLLNRQAIGPLAPNGAASYIPQQSALQRINHVPPPQLYNPAYRNSTPNAGANGAPGEPVAHAAPVPQFSPGMVSYPVNRSLAQPNSYFVDRRVSSTQPSAEPAQPPTQMVQLPFNEATLRYLARLEKERNTKSTTQPSQDMTAPATRPAASNVEQPAVQQ